ncbi:hypothetical protein B0A52_10319 [Exophiala mesophila]|uniref:SURP motif domain-containing protein n=1 Tax=Exophiala mesophila TaxID=212818 RepID=A0A438MS67_EXOME|nr:hypothetical protein B0A52_10319 [Exophiala mesophila]
MAQNGSSIPDLPESATKAPEGVVLPPKDIRAIIEKTAGYVARNGTVFEDRIRDKEHANPKFSFLSPNDAYAPFYLWRLSEVRAGRGTAVSAGRAGEDTKPVTEKAKGPEPPSDYQFSARMPNISALDLEVVKLTALHVARKGKGWMTALSQREARNYQFDFLRPQHSLYNFFQRLVDQYSILLLAGPEGQKAEQARIQILQSNIQDHFRVLGLARKRAEYVKWQESQKQQKEEAEEAEKLAYAQIDWHDFVVVETVLFTEADEQADLPPTTTLNELQSTSLEQKAMMSLSRPDMRIEEAMPTDDMDGYSSYSEYPSNPYPQHTPSSVPFPHQPPSVPQYTPSPSLPQPPLQTGYYPHPTPPPQIPSPAPVPTPTTASPAPGAGQPAMRIKSDYVPRAQQRTARAAATALCPNCNQQIPVAELDAHLRIELLDPRWKEQQSKAAARFSTTNLGGTDVAANLKRLREKTDRSAGGGGSGDVVAEAAARVLAEQDQLNEEERRKRMKMDPGNGVGVGVGVGYPGQQPSQPMNVQDQIRQIHSKYAS